MVSTLSFVIPTVAMTANGNIPVSDFQTKDFYESTAVKTASEKGLIQKGDYKRKRKNHTPERADCEFANTKESVV